MTTLARSVLMMVISIAAAAPPAAAQERRPTRPPSRRSRIKPPPRVDRGYIVGGAGFLLTPTTFSDVARPIDFAEPAVVNSSFRFSSAASVDIGGAYRVRPQWSVGLQLTRFGKAGR